MYNYYQQQVPYGNYAGVGYSQNIPGPMGIKGRPVASLEEVRAAQIDFDGTVSVFPDLAHKRIYTKQIGMDGNPSLNIYELIPQPTPVSSADITNLVTKEELEIALAQLKESLTQAPEKKDLEKKAEGSATPQFNF